MTDERFALGAVWVATDPAFMSVVITGPQVDRAWPMGKMRPCIAIAECGQFDESYTDELIQLSAYYAGHLSSLFAGLVKLCSREAARFEWPSFVTAEINFGQGPSPVVPRTEPAVSYWSQPLPVKPAQPWTGTERREVKGYYG